MRANTTAASAVAEARTQADIATEAAEDAAAQAKIAALSAEPIEAPAVHIQRGASDTADMDLPADVTVNIPTDGDLQKMARVDPNAHGLSAAQLEGMPKVGDPAKYLADLAFNEDVLTVIVAESQLPNEDPLPASYVNGVAQVFPRGQAVQAKRKYVAALAMAKPQLVEYQNRSAVTTGEGDMIKYTKKSSLMYPFQVVSDPAGMRGVKWLQQVLKQH